MDSKRFNAAVRAVACPNPTCVRPAPHRPGSDCMGLSLVIVMYGPVEMPADFQEAS